MLKDLQDSKEIWKPGKVKLDAHGKLAKSAPDVTPPEVYCPQSGGAHSIKLTVTAGNDEKNPGEAMFLTVAPPRQPPSATAPDAAIGMPNAAPGFA